MQQYLAINNSSANTPVRGAMRMTVLALAISATFSSAAFAEDAVLPTVTVSGQAASMESALDVQQAADNVVSAVHSDGINQLPDGNAAEALQRLPGVSVQRDQGEGRYVSIRGTDPNLNSVNINGSLVPSPEDGTRAVALDVLPAGMVQSLEVSKTFMPSQDANSIGGTIDVKTMSAFDHDGTFASGTIGGTYDSNLETAKPEGAVTFSKRFLDGKLGIAVGVSSSERKYGSDNMETGGAWEGGGLTEFERRDYTVNRKRDSGALNLDYRPSSKESYFIRTLHSKFKDDEVRQRHGIEFSPATGPGVTGNFDDTERQVRQREETQKLTNFTLGGERQFDDWTIGMSAGMGKASENNPDNMTAKFEYTGPAIANLGYDDTRTPQLIGDLSNINDASNYQLDKIELKQSRTEDKEKNIKFDLKHNHQMFGLDSELQFGGKLSRREKTNDVTEWEVDAGAFIGSSMAQYTCGTVDYKYGAYGPAICPSKIRSLISGVDLSGFLDATASTIADYQMHEDINAAYVQNTFNVGMWRILAGVRHERAKFTASGTGDNNGTLEAVNVNVKRNHWFPALHVRRDLDNNTTVRAAWTKTLARPTFEQLAPGFEDDGTDAEMGNPNLKPARSSNFDLGIERRLGYAGVASAYVFYKDISDFVFATDLAGSGAYAAYDTVKTWNNGDQAKVYGLELAYSRTINEGALKGFLFAANATLTKSDADINGYSGGSYVPSRSIDMPGQSDFSMNMMVGYKRGPWDLRLAANHKSPYLLEVSDVGDANKDQYVDKQTQWDLSLKYDITKNSKLIFEAINLTDEDYYVYQGSKDYNVQHESYGRMFKLSYMAHL